MKKLNIKYEKPENLIPYENNHKIHSEEQIARLANSIKTYGFDQPIVVDKNYVIIKGHGRREAALQLKLKKVPIIVNDELDEQQIKAARIADNKTSSNEYNIEALKFDIGTLNIQDFNLSLLGIQKVELDLLIKDIDLTSFTTNHQNQFPEKKENLPLQNNQENENTYSDKIATPIYEPSGERPDINDLVDLSKYRSLCNEIERSNLGKEEKEFLLLAASRHIVFNYEKIANYYAHSLKPLQELFENSALVIIDFDKAVENGFVKLSKEMNESYINNGDDDN